MLFKKVENKPTAEMKYYAETKYYSPVVMGAMSMVAAICINAYSTTGADNFQTLLLLKKTVCCVISISTAMNISAQWKFYDWFYDSGVSKSNCRGISTRAYPLFGFIPFPVLSKASFKTASVLFLLMLFYSATVETAQNAWIGSWLLLILSLLYFSSLWAERSASYHREIPCIVFFMYLAMGQTALAFMSSNSSSSSDSMTMATVSGTESSAASIDTMAWKVILLMKLHISSIYCAGGLQKIICSLAQQSPWFLHTPHTLCWQAMFSKPFFPTLQRAVFLHPRLMAVSALAVLTMETLLPLALLTPSQMQLLCAVALIKFHTGVFLVQGIDYVSYWCPVLLVWCIRTHSDDGNTLQLLSETFFDTFAAAKATVTSASSATTVDSLPLLLLLPCVVFCTAQLLFSAGFLESFWIDLPPLMSCPMFVSVAALQRPGPAFYVMSDLRTELPYEQLEWLYPFVKQQCGLGMDTKDTDKYPFKFVGFGYYSDPALLPYLQRVQISGELLQHRTGFFLFSNFSVSDELTHRLQQLMLSLHAEADCSCSGSCAMSAAELQQLYAEYRTCYQLFIEHCVNDNE